MTHEESNGTASDDQRCYIERLQEIERTATELRDLLQEGKARPGEFQSKLAALDNAIGWNSAALEANR